MNADTPNFRRALVEEVQPLAIRITPGGRTRNPLYHETLETVYDGAAEQREAVIDICEGMDHFAHSRRAELLEAILRNPPAELLAVCRDVLRIVESGMEEPPAIESDEDFAHRMRTTGTHDGEARKWGGQKLAEMISKARFPDQPAVCDVSEVAG